MCDVWLRHRCVEDPMHRWDRELVLGADWDEFGDLFGAAIRQLVAQPELQWTDRCATCAGVYKSELPC